MSDVFDEEKGYCRVGKHEFSLDDWFDPDEMRTDCCPAHHYAGDEFVLENDGESIEVLAAQCEQMDRDHIVTQCSACTVDIDAGTIADLHVDSCSHPGCDALICAACAGRGDDLCHQHAIEAERNFEKSLDEEFDFDDDEFGDDDAFSDDDEFSDDDNEL